MTCAQAQLGALPWDLQWLLVPGGKARAARELLALPNRRRKLEIMLRQWGVLSKLPKTDATRAAQTKALRAFAASEKAYDDVMRTVWDALKRAQAAGKIRRGQVRLVDVSTGSTLTDAQRSQLGFLGFFSLLLIVSSVAVATTIVGYLGPKWLDQIAASRRADAITQQAMAEFAAQFQTTGRVSPGLIDLLDTAKPTNQASGLGLSLPLIALAAVAAFFVLRRRRAAA